MINGHLLYVMSNCSYSEKVAVTISTIAALMKEFSLDWAVNDLDAAELKEQRHVLEQLGFYCQIPVKTLNQLLRKRIKCGIRHPEYGLGEFIRKFQSLYRPEPVKMLLLASYLFTAFKAVRMSKPDFSMPFTIDITSKGSVFLVYHYRSKRTGRIHIRKYDLGCRFPNQAGTISPAMAKLFKE
jgi:hypothetical protein